MKIKYITLVIYSGFLARCIIAAWNGFFGPSPGAQWDAQTFYNAAVEVSYNLQFESFTIGPNLYINALGVIFHYTGASLFLGCLLSCFAWLWSTHVFVKILDLMRTTSQMKLKAVFIYSFYPSSVMFTSITFREPFQLLFLTLSVYCALKIYYQGNIFRFINLCIYILLMGVLHGAMLITSIIVFNGAFLLYLTRKHYKVSYSKIFIFLLLIAPVILYLFSFTFKFSYDFSNGLLETAKSYQIGLISDHIGRSTYKTMEDLKNSLNLLWFAFYGFLQYFLKPFPWEIDINLDIVVMLEGYLRLYLLWLTYKNFKIRESSADLGWIFVLLIFFVNEFIWSLGTVNWGTAMRHHIPPFSCLLIVAFSVPRGSRKINFNQGHQA